MVGQKADRLVNELAEAALDAVRRCLFDVPDGAPSVQAAIDAPGATSEVPTCDVPPCVLVADAHAERREYAKVLSRLENAVLGLSSSVNDGFGPLRPKRRAAARDRNLPVGCGAQYQS